MITPTYEVLRSLTSPVVAITSKRGDEQNGMIANSAMRASLSADKPRVSAYIHKFNYSHDMIYDSGKFVLHLLHRGQMNVVYSLGFQSLRDGEKISSVDHHIGESGLPVLDDCYAFFECDVINVMDTGASTLFLGGVTASGRGDGEEILDSEYMRNEMPEERARQYLADLQIAMQQATEMGDTMQSIYNLH